jgi:putative membrane protein
MSPVTHSQPPPDEAQTEASKITRELDFLALIRTAFSAERSLMAWLRTSVSLYTFGFSFTKFFDFLGPQTESTHIWAGPQGLGLGLICLGILALTLATLVHIRRFRKMKQLGLPTLSRFSLPISAAVALLTIGVTTLIGVAIN